MITQADYDQFRRLLKTRSGLVLTEDKHYLLESRLSPVARRFGLTSLADLAAKLRGPAAGTVEDAVVEAMTTNESFFFRDKKPFEAFTNVMLPAVVKARAPGQTIRIWCAAASTGQEPYSLAMSLKESASLLGGRRVEIIGTDLSSDVLDRARLGLYSQFEVQRGLPIQYLLKYFTKMDDSWQISNELRGMIDYRKFNLLEPFHSLGRFDIVFCRNVLIYFDAPTKADVLNRISRVMAPDGYLVLGGAETIVGLTDALKAVPQNHGLYTVNTAAGADAPRRVGAAP